MRQALLRSLVASALFTGCATSARAPGADGPTATAAPPAAESAEGSATATTSGAAAASATVPEAGTGPGATAAPLNAAAKPTVRLAPVSLPLPLSRPATAVVGGKVLALGGLTTGDTSTDAVVVLDPAGPTVARLAPLPQRVHDAAAAPLGADGALVFAGGGSSITDVVQRWSPTGKQAGDHLPKPRADLASAVIGDRTLILGGTDGTTLDPTVLATTDGRTFTSIGQLAQGVRYPAVAVAGSTVWLFGGETQATEGGKVVRTDVIQTFDTATGTGRIVGHLPQPLSHAMACTLGGQVLLAGGRTDRGPVGTLYRARTSGVIGVDPVGQLPGPLSDAGVGVIDRTAYLIGGEVSGPKDPQSTVVEITL